MVSVIVDLDGTVADCDWRLPLIKEKPKNWKAFFEGIPKDPPIDCMIEMVRAFRQAGSLVIYCTGRPDHYRRESLMWLNQHSISAINGLYMRPKGDHSPDYECKKRLLAQIRADGYNPTIVIDDKPEVCDMFRDEGLVVLQVKRK